MNVTRIVASSLPCIACLALITAAARLNTSWLVPAGNVHVDYKTLARPEMKVCALTFDDGPDSVYTPQVAAILGKYKVHATFFVVGTRFDANPKVVVSLAAAGHEIGNHTQSHPHMPKISAERQRTELTQVQAKLAPLGIAPHWFRPPYGAFTAGTVRVASKLGLSTVLWSVDPRDWAEPGVAKIQSRVLSATVPGAVILLHCTHGQTVQALPGIIEGLQREGYRFVTMSDWAAAVSGGLSTNALPALPQAGSLPPNGLQEEPAEAFALPLQSPAAPETSDRPGAPTPPVSPAPANPGQPLNLLTHANFADAEQLGRMWAGKAGYELQVWPSNLASFGGVEGYLIHANPGLHPRPKVELVVPAPMAGQPGSSVTSDLDLASWATRTDWSPPAALTADDLAAGQSFAGQRFRAAPHYYFLAPTVPADPALWPRLRQFQQAGAIDGLVLSGPKPWTWPTDAPAPVVSVGGTKDVIPTAAVLDLSLHGVSRLLEALRQGQGNIYLVLRPSNIDGFVPTDSPVASGQREFIAFRQLTWGLDYDAAPENDFAPSWPLPQGVRLARFFDPAHEVVILYSPEGVTATFGLPSAAQAYRMLTWNTLGKPTAAAPPSALSLGRGVLFLYRELH